MQREKKNDIRCVVRRGGGDGEGTEMGEDGERERRSQRIKEE